MGNLYNRQAQKSKKSKPNPILCHLIRVLCSVYLYVTWCNACNFVCTVEMSQTHEGGAIANLDAEQGYVKLGSNFGAASHMQHGYSDMVKMTRRLSNSIVARSVVVEKCSEIEHVV